MVRLILWIKSSTRLDTRSGGAVYPSPGSGALARPLVVCCVSSSGGCTQ